MLEDPKKHVWKDPVIKAMYDAIEEELARMEKAGEPAPQTMTEHRQMMDRAFNRAREKASKGDPNAQG